MNSISERWRSQSARIRASLSGGSRETTPALAAASCMARSESSKVAVRSAAVPSRNARSGIGSAAACTVAESTHAQRAPRGSATPLSVDVVDVLAAVQVLEPLGPDAVHAGAAVDPVEP